MKFDADGEMDVETLHPGVSREDVREATGWDVRFAEDLGETPTPSAEGVALIREDLDADGIYTGGGD